MHMTAVFFSPEPGSKKINMGKEDDAMVYCELRCLNQGVNGTMTSVDCYTPNQRNIMKAGHFMYHVMNTLQAKEKKDYKKLKQGKGRKQKKDIF